MKKSFKLLSTILATLTVMSAPAPTFAASYSCKKVLKYGLIGAGVTFAAVKAYKYFNEKTIEINSEKDFEQVENCRNTITKAVINVETIPEYAFKDCTKLKEVELNAVKHIENAAFIRCESLKIMKNSSVVKTIGEYVFSGCLALKEIDFSGAEHIQKGAFWGCESLNKIDLSSITHIGTYSFSCCTSLKNVILPQNSVDFQNSILAQTCKTNGEIEFCCN